MLNATSAESCGPLLVFVQHSPIALVWTGTRSCGDAKMPRTWAQKFGLGESTAAH